MSLPARQLHKLQEIEGGLTGSTVAWPHRYGRIPSVM